jgi:hypothetical protein
MALVSVYHYLFPQKTVYEERDIRTFHYFTIRAATQNSQKELENHTDTKVTKEMRNSNALCSLCLCGSSVHPNLTLRGDNLRFYALTL